MSAVSGPWPAPAKLNLMLRIVGRRADGYHELQTVFQFLDFGDELYFTAADDARVVRLGGAKDVEPGADLVVKAARLLKAETGCPLGARIDVHKRLPVGGGLGGGSSDAATTLAVLNRLWGLHLREDELARLGLRLGADVPVFLLGRAAWGEGVGECLEPLELPQPWYVVVCPDCHVSTARVFQDPELTRNSPRSTIRDFIAGARDNDCRPVVVARYPEVAAALQWLGQYGEARLTGTGGCVFAEFDTEAAARRVLQEMPATLRGFHARAVNESPLRQRLRAAGTPWPPGDDFTGA